MPQLITNNATSRLVGSLASGATSMTIEAPTADRFPVANTSNWVSPVNWFKAVIQNSLGAIEIVRVGIRASGSAVFSNLQRAQEGTTALDFDAGAVVRLSFTAGDLQAALAGVDQAVRLTGAQTVDGVKTFNDPVVADITGNAATADEADHAAAADTALVAATVSTTVASGATGTTQPAKTANTSIATTAFVDRLRSMGNSTNGATPTIDDRGSVMFRNANTTIPSGVFAKNDVLTIINNSTSNITLIQGSGLTMNRSGVNANGNRSLGPFACCTLVFESPTLCYAAGAGVT